MSSTQYFNGGIVSQSLSLDPQQISNITYNPSSTGFIFNSNLIPASTEITLGNITNPWKSMYVSTGTIFFGSQDNSLLINTNDILASPFGFASPEFYVGETPGNGIVLYNNQNILWSQDQFGASGPISIFKTAANSINNTYFTGGNLGIGISVPIYPLDVNGNIHSSDTVLASSFSGTNMHISSIESTNSTLNIATTDNKTNTVNIGTSNSTQTVNIGTVGGGATTINIGGIGDTVNVAGNLVYVNSTVTEISNPQLIINQSGTNINNTGLTVSQNGGPTGAYILVNSASNAWTLKAGAGQLVTLNQDVSNGANVTFGTETLSNLILNTDTISLGTNSNAKSNSVGIGYQTLQTSSGPYAVAIGYQTSQNGNTGGYSVSIGYKAGQTNQGENTIAVGYESGLTSQGKYSISMGPQSGRTSQGQYGISLGYQSGYDTQSTNSIAIGNGSGRTTQGQSSVAIGNGAGYSNQGQNCIAIGQNAGNTNQSNNSIVLNAQSSNLNGLVSGLYIDPIRNTTGPNFMYYNSSTKEVTQSTLTDLTLSNLSVNNYTGSSAYINSVTTNKVMFDGDGSIYFQTGSSTGCYIDGIHQSTGSCNLYYEPTTKMITYTRPNYLYAYYTGVQSTSATSFTGVLFNQVPILDGFTHVINKSSFTFTADTNGIYQISYSLEVHNNNNGAESLTAYIDLDGTPISGSARSIELNSSTVNEATLSNLVLTNISSGSHTIQILAKSSNATRISLNNPTNVVAPGLAGSAASITIHRII